MGRRDSIPIVEGEIGPPRSGFVLRLCIRKADEAWGEAALGHGLADTRFCRTRSRHSQVAVAEASPSQAINDSATVSASVDDSSHASLRP